MPSRLDRHGGARDTRWCSSTRRDDRRARLRTTDDVGEMLASSELTQPGPVCVAVSGDVGVFEGDDHRQGRERLRPRSVRSAVCTHPWAPPPLAAGLLRSSPSASAATRRSSTTQPTTTQSPAQLKRSAPCSRDAGSRVGAVAATSSALKSVGPRRRRRPDPRSRGAPVKPATLRPAAAGRSCRPARRRGRGRTRCRCRRSRRAAARSRAQRS